MLIVSFSIWPCWTCGGKKAIRPLPNPQWNDEQVVDGPKREVPPAVRKRLRQEVGFGCPVPRCRSPFLEYHHFDPEWHVEHHHRPEGLIPLCPTHHAQAASFTLDQLRTFKETAANLAAATGRFEWLRHQLIGAVGGNLYLDTPILVQFRSDPMVWFNRDSDGHALLNVRMLTTVGNEAERIRIEDNDFIVRGTPVDFECPPSGRLLRVRYENGDYMRVEFREFGSPQTASNKFTHMTLDSLHMLPATWPLTFVIVTMRAGGTNIRFGPSMTRLPGNNVIRGCTMVGGQAGLVFG